MNIFKNMKVRTRYIGPVMLSTAALLVIIFYGLQNLKENTETFVEFIDKDQTQLIILSNMYSQGLQSEQATRNVLLNPSDNKALGNYDKANDDFKNLVESAKKN